MTALLYVAAVKWTVGFNKHGNPIKYYCTVLKYTSDVLVLYYFILSLHSCQREILYYYIS